MTRRMLMTLAAATAAVGLVAAQTTGRTGANPQQPGTTPQQPGTTQTQPGTTGQPPTGATSGYAGGQATQMRPIPDQEFALLAGSGGLMEVQAGQLAQQRGTTDEVKRFGQKLVEDHNRLNQQLGGILAQRGVAPPNRLITHHAAIMQRLMAANGPDFDREFAAGQIGAHVEAVAIFSDYAKTGQDPQLKQFAAQALPRLQQHLQEAEQLLRNLPAGTTGGQHEQGTGAENRGTSGGAGTRPPSPANTRPPR